MAYPMETKFYGKLNFKTSWIGIANKETGAKGGSIGVLDNGTWLHFPSGHPLSLEEGTRILNEVAPAQVARFQNWYEQKEQDAVDAELDAPRPIRVCRDDILRFEDGEQEEVVSAAPIFAYFAPGSMALESALALFQARQKGRQGEVTKDLLSKTQDGETNLDKSFGRTRAGRSQPATDPIDKEELKQRRLENLAKARAVKKEKMEQSKAQESVKPEIEPELEIDSETDELAIAALAVEGP